MMDLAVSGKGHIRSIAGKVLYNMTLISPLLNCIQCITLKCLIFYSIVGWFSEAYFFNTLVHVYMYKCIENVSQNPAKLMTVGVKLLHDFHFYLIAGLYSVIWYIDIMQYLILILLSIFPF